jgi:hypothetical protein
MFLIPFILAFVTAEIAVTPATLVPGAFAYGSATVAANGDRALVVWHDHRGITGDVYAARIDRTGNVLDPAGIRLLHGDAEFAVAPAPDGGWLVATAGNGGAAVVRVSRDGALSPPKQIETWSGGTTGVQMATNGETFLIVTNANHALLVGLDGSVVAGPLTLPVLGFLPVVGFPRTAVASNGRDYLIVTSGSDGLMESVVTRAGALGAPQTPFPGTHAAAVAIVSDGNRYFIAAVVPPARILTAFAAANGTILGAPQSAQQLDVLDVRAVTDGRDFGLVWSVFPRATSPTHSLLYGSPVDASGRIANPQQLSARITDYPAAFDLTDLAGNILLVHSADHRLFGAFTSIGVMNGPLPPDVPIQKIAAAQVNPRLTATGAGAVVVWHDDETEGWRAETLDPDGRPSGRVVDFPGPQVAFDGINVVVAWHRNDGALVAQRFDTALNAVDVQPIVITTTNVSTTLAAGGGGVALFAWTSQNDSAGSDSAHGAILTRGGAVVPVALPQLPVPAAAWNGSEFLVVYAVPTGPPPLSSGHPDPPDYVRALRVAPDGRVLDAAPHTIAYSFGAIGRMAAASNGGRFLVAWRTGYLQGYDGDRSPVVAQYVDANGAPAGQQVVLSPNDADNGPYLTPFGSGYAVAWQKGAAVEKSVLLWRTTESGTIASLPPMGPAHYGADAAIAAIGERLELAYSHIDDTVGGVERVFVRNAGAPERPRASR